MREKKKKKKEEGKKEENDPGMETIVWNLHMFGLCMESTYIGIMYGIDV